MQNKIEKLHSLIATTMSKSQQGYAINLLNDIIANINFNSEVVTAFKAKRIGVNKLDYSTYVEKCIRCMVAIGFHPTEVVNYDKDAIEFIIQHKHKFKKPLTIEYFNNIHKLYQYYEWTNNESPKNLNDLNNAYTEIKDNRESEL